MNDDWWKHFLGNKTKKYYWFDLNTNEVSLISNVLYKHLSDKDIRTLTIIIEATGDGSYSLVAIVSGLNLTQKEMIDALKEIPNLHSNDWRQGR